MANILKMEKTILIQELLQLGWSYRQIERETDIRRETIAKYDPQRSKPAKDQSTLRKPAIWSGSG